MRRFDCPDCGFYMTEADKVWDEYQQKKGCPNCALIKSGFSKGSKSGKEFIGIKSIRKNRIFAGLVLILFALIFYITPTTFHFGKGSSLISIIQSTVGNEGVAFLLLIIGAHFTYSGLRK